jgi:hypothetical protein
MNLDINAQSRLFQRHNVNLDARIEPHPDHASQWRLAQPDSQTGLAVVDVSKGGFGLRSGVYVPRSLRVTLHISGGGQREGGLDRQLRIPAVVRRCILVDHKPTYQIGLQFVDAAGADEQYLVRALLGGTEQPEKFSVGGNSVIPLV